MYDELSDEELVVLTCYLEARNQGPEGMAAVAGVIMNRHHLWGQDVRAVCLWPGQFQCFDAEKVLAEKIAGNWEESLVSDHALTLAYANGMAVVNGSLASGIGRCTFYERYDCSHDADGKPVPSPWFRKQLRRGAFVEYKRIRDHVFYLESRFAQTGGSHVG